MVNTGSDTLERRDRLVRLADAAIASDGSARSFMAPAPREHRRSRLLAVAVVVSLLVVGVGLAVALSAGDGDELTTAGDPSSSFEPVQASANAVVMIYSGRPNPTWVLSADDAATVRGSLEQLPRIDPPDSEIEPALGFSGFRIDGPDTLLPSVSITPGLVVVTNADKTTTSFSDPDNVALKTIAAIAQRNIPADDARVLAESIQTD